MIAIVGDAAVGNVIAIPTRRRIVGIEVGQTDLADVPSRTVYQEPTATLPLPVRCCLFVLQRVVDAIRAANCEHPVGHVMGIPGCELLDSSVHSERADLQIDALRLAWPDEKLDRHPFAEHDDVGLAGS